MRKINVALGLPTGGTIHIHLMSQIIDQMFGDTRVSLRIISFKDKPYEQALAQVHQLFLKTNCQYLVSIDSDTVPTKNPLDLVFLDKPVICLPTPMWRPGIAASPILFNAFVADGNAFKTIEPDAELGLQQVRAAGSSAMVIRRDVLTQIKAPFVREWSPETGLVLSGTDIAFSNRLHEAGIPLHVHWGYKCHHYNEIDMLAVFAGIAEVFKRAQGRRIILPGEAKAKPLQVVT